LIATAVDGPPPATLTIEVGHVRNAQGRVHVALCPRAQFLSETCPYESSAPAAKGVTIITITAPPGDYAAQAFHDENGNHQVDKNLLGIPREGVGFSRNARIRFGPPKWADAVITHGAQAQTIQLDLRYMLGD
jgi:uncharacterized protein (DUF2141 family)